MYLLILDSDKHPDYWIYVCKSEDLEQLRSRRCYDPQKRRTKSKDGRPGNQIERKLLPSCYNLDGLKAGAGIYKVLNFNNSEESAD